MNLNIRDIFDRNDSDRVVKLPVKDIYPSRYQPRLRFDETALNELTDSIRENGLIQPITVRKTADGYEIIAGERRYRACIKAGYKEIPCYILTPTEDQAARMALVENVQRENLSAIEEAKSYVQIMRQSNMTQEQVAKAIGKSQPAVANKIRLLNLPDEVQEGVVSGKITERHARALLSVPQGQIRPTYRHIVHAGLNVRAAEEYIAALNRGEVKPKPKKRKQKTKGFTRNMQIAVNSVNQCVEMITKMGIQATVEADDQDNELRMIIHLPK